MRPREEGMHAVTKIIKAVAMEIMIEKSKEYNNTAMTKRVKTVNERKNKNYPIRRHNSSGHTAPLGLTGERYISDRGTRFGKDSNPARLHKRPDYAIQPPPMKGEELIRRKAFNTTVTKRKFG
ncbi:hypothetical protein E2C01_079700 [Portunus trituberculatus]|uniref:Uncharacterized protein n=1 Tax=Portunus trituberculatus TaxID=210409 RepID=A0A5B7ITG6_PORTR|nr:hypothetical protein [Portunus trituberculatus]